MKQWKEIPGYEDYQITPDGEVRKKKKKGYRLCVASLLEGTNYFMVNLIKDKKCKRAYLHRLVATVYLPNPDPAKYDSVGFKDKESWSVSVDNLYWTNQEELMQKRKKANKYAKGSDHHYSHLSEEDVKEIRRAFSAGEATKTELGRQYGIKSCSIHSIVQRLTWKHI